MVLKFEQEENEIFLLDATFQNGVAIQRWSILKKYLIGGGKQSDLSPNASVLTQADGIKRSHT